MTKSKYEFSLEGDNELELGNANFKEKKFEAASENFEKAIANYKASLDQTGNTEDPKGLEVNTRKNLGFAIQNYGSSMIDWAKTLGASNLSDNLDDIVKHLGSAIKVMKEEGVDYEKALESNLVTAQKNLATYYYKSKEYEEAIKEFVELEKYDSIDRKAINPIILSAYCLKAQGETNQKAMLEEALTIMKDMDENTLKSRSPDADYVLHYLVKTYILDDVDIKDLNELYNKVHDNKSLVETLYRDTIVKCQDGKENKDKGILKEAVTILSFIAKEVHKLEINSELKSLVTDYGTLDTKSNYNDLLSQGHVFDINDFDFS